MLTVRKVQRKGRQDKHSNVAALDGFYVSE